MTQVSPGEQEQEERDLETSSERFIEMKSFGPNDTKSENNNKDNNI